MASQPQDPFEFVSMQAAQGSQHHEEDADHTVASSASGQDHDDAFSPYEFMPAADRDETVPRIPTYEESMATEADTSSRDQRRGTEEAYSASSTGPSASSSAQAQVSSAAAPSSERGHDQETVAAEAAAIAAHGGNASRGRVMMGHLPETFLRLTHFVEMRPQMFRASGGSSSMLSITIVQARLAKSYALVGKMDPYVTVHVGGFQRSTDICSRGGKEPRWNATIQLPRLPLINSIRVAVYDMGVFSDRLVGYGDIDISELTDDQPMEGWYHLSGKQGKDKEGVIQCIIRSQPSNLGPFFAGGAPMAPFDQVVSSTTTYYPDGSVMTNYGGGSTVVTVRDPSRQRAYLPADAPAGQSAQYQPQQRQQPQQQQQRPVGDEEIKQLKEMFPSLSEDVLQSVLVANGGRMEPTVSQLLAM